MRRALLFLLLAATLPLAAQERLPDPPTAGTVVDMQGRAYVRPAGHTRWSPVRPGTRLLIGDTLKTGLRGAHAVEVRLPRSGRVLLGPGSIGRFPKPELFRLVEGEAEIRTKGRSVVRMRDGARTVLDHDPAWLTGYRASTTDEWLGSLVANVDGRNVPLSIGFHHVRVVIRDQVAETTIDESFKNATDQVLEGEFVFPLPPDASISGFGMWIDDELVMADVVERQRARAIYEDIKRRRVDPALLEWAGGNLFKASVFPIPAHGEKRIRIRYTQVLPLTGNAFRYRYPLASEMLRTSPLRDLNLRVDVHSTVPLAAADCPSHDALVEHTKHSARIEHTARAVSPDRDFEAEFTLDARPPLVAVPHRRGEDGYFLLLLGPPDPESGPLTRALTPDSEPLDLVLLLDTSGSMGPDDRKAQAEFVDALLALTGEKDRARIAVCDTALHWIEDPAAATARTSLGWSDLGAAFDEVLEAAGPGAHVIYVGDGRVTARGEAAEDLARKLRGSGSKATAHAVSTGSSFERPVLEALASIGGGTVRAADPDPARAAYRLLAGIARPALKDLKVTFEGIRTARVYPDRLPNLPAGTQQAILGRFLVTGGDQEGLVVVTGTRDGEPVRFTAPLVVREGEEGNSFLPRLWARRHLDSLLAEELTKPVRAEIVETSQRFSIMTPLTSFLVLESDADREHYGVKRTFAMRDGERFFTEARETAGREILADQMQKAHAWRLGLRKRMVRDIRRLGRNLTAGGGDTGRSGFGYFEESQPLFGKAEEGEQLLGGGVDEYFDEEAEEEEAEETAEAGDEVLLEEKEVEPMLAYEGGAPLPSADWTRTRRIFTGGGGMDADDWRLYNLTGLFPYLDEPWEPDEPETDVTGSEEARTLLRSLDRRKALTDFPGGVELDVRFESLHPVRGTLLNFGQTDLVATKDAWVLTEEDDTGDPTITWCAGDERGALDGALRIGRVRRAVESDRGALPEFPGAPGREFYQWGKGWRAEVLSRDGGKAVIALTWRDAPWPSSRLTIDTARGVLLKTEDFIRGKLNRTTDYSEHVLVAGVHWPTRMVTTDAKGRVTQRNTFTVRARSEDEARARIAELRGALENAILLPEPMPSDRAAKQAAHEGRATFADQLALALLDARFGRQDEMLERWGRAEKLVPGKRGAAYIRAAFLSVHRNGEALLRELTALAEQIAAPDAAYPAALAERVYDLENDRLSGEEKLGLLAALQPAWDRPGEHRERLRRRWAERRINAVRRPDRTEARRLRLALSEAYPDDPELIVQSLYDTHYATDREAALERAIAALRRDDRWTDREAMRVYSTLSDILENRDRHEDLVSLAARWQERLPADPNGYALHLSLLADEDRFDERDAWIAERLTEDVPPAPDDDSAQARIRAAIDAVLDVHRGGHDPRWGPRLRDASLAMVLRDGPESALGLRIVRRDPFHATDAGRELRAEVEKLLSDPGTISSAPLSALRPLLEQLSYRSRPEDEFRRRVTAGLAARFSDRNERAVGVLLAKELSDRGEFEESVRIRRALLASKELEGTIRVRELMEEILKLPWSPERESEALGLLPRTVFPDDDKEERRAELAEATAGLIAKLLPLRERALLPDAAEREQWSRAELRRRTKAARKEAAKGLAIRLRNEAKDAQPELRRWLELEALTLDTRAGMAPGQIRLLAEDLLAHLPDDEDDAWLRLFRNRAWTLLDAAALRSPKVAGWTLGAYRSNLPTGSKAVDWQFRIWRLLLALDRPEELETALRSLIVGGNVESRWRIGLAYLLAERGRLAEAVSLLEECERLGELQEAGYLSLADFRLALGDEKGREEALDARFRTVSEERLDSYVSGIFESYDEFYDDDVPAPPPPVSEDQLRVLRALARKSSEPSYILDMVWELHDLTGDHRLLTVVAETVRGHSPLVAFSCLETVASLLETVDDEATLDAISDHARAIRAETETDLRALSLLVAAVERRATEVMDNPEVHAARGLAALKAGCPREFAPGEGRHFADFLHALGEIPDDALAAEQVRLLTALHEKAEGADRFDIAHTLALTHQDYGRLDVATDLLVAALEEAGEDAPERELAVKNLLTLLKKRALFSRAETWLLDHPLSDGYDPRLDRLYIECLESGGAVSIGKGAELYRAVRKRIRDRLGVCPSGDLASTIARFLSLHEAAKRRKIKGVRDDALSFATEELPALLDRVPSDRGGTTASAASSLRNIAGPTPALAFLLRRLDEEPEGRRRTGRGCFRRVSHGLSSFWKKVPAKDKEALKPRLEKVLCRELEWLLLSHQDVRYAIFDARRGAFLPELAGAFEEVAEEVAKQNAESPALVFHAAEYLDEELGLPDWAAKLLAGLDERGKLSDVGRRRLALLLVRKLEDYESAVPHLVKFAASHPLDVSVLTDHVLSLGKLGETEKAKAVLEAGLSRIDEAGGRTADSLYSLGNACVNCGLPEQAAPLLTEGIRTAERGDDRRRVGHMYGDLAEAYSLLGRHAEALDAASAGIVARRSLDQESREDAIDRLSFVFDRIEDLDAFTEEYDAKVEATGLDAPMIRKAIARARMERDETEAALRELRIARALSPADEDLHAWTLECLDSAGDEEGACRAILDRLAIFPRDVEAIADLAVRYDDLGLEADAERARTTLVEAGPLEADGWVRLAEAREEAERFDDEVACLSRAVALRTFDPALLVALSDAQVRADDREAARAALTRVLSGRWAAVYRDVVEEARAALEDLGEEDDDQE